MCRGCSRVDWIRTSDPLHPIQVRYRAAPLPEQKGCKSKLKYVFPKIEIDTFRVPGKNRP